MRTLIFLPLLLASAAASAQAPAADPVPLDPAWVGTILTASGASGGLRVEMVQPGSSAQRAGVTPGALVTAVDGTPVAGLTNELAEALLIGARGTTATVTLVPASGGPPRQVKLARDRGLNALWNEQVEYVASPHFVVHHSPGMAARAREVAAMAEREYAALRLPASTARRGHLFIFSSGKMDKSRVSYAAPPVWAVGVDVDPEEGSFSRPDAVFGYMAYGVPGRLGMNELAPREWWVGDPTERHRAAARLLITMDGVEGLVGTRAKDHIFQSEMGVSLRAFLRERYGDEKVAALWASDESMDAASRRVLGKSEVEVLREWEAVVRSLGPSADVGMTRGGAVVALGFGALTLLAGLRVASRKEVG